jgi:lipopolysaccharide export system permease protein
MNRIERYLGRVLLQHTLLVWLVLLLILGLSELMLQIGMLREGYTLIKGGAYALLKLPVYAYEIFPIALLIGTLIGLGSLANQGELTVLRVTGWSLTRIVLAVMKTALLAWLVVALLGEMVAPASEAYATKLRAQALQKNMTIGDRSDFWMKEEARLIHVTRAVSESELHGVTVYGFEGAQLVSVVQAPTAIYQRGAWQLAQAVEQKLSWQPALDAQAHPQRLVWQVSAPSLQVQTFPIDPALLTRLHVQTRYMRIDDLYAYIGFLQQNGLDAAPYQLEFWRKLANPLAVVAMLILVFPLLFGSQRQVSIGQRIFVGILIGMGFHLLNQIFGNLSVVYQLAPGLGAFLPSLALGVIGGILLRRLPR